MILKKILESNETPFLTVLKSMGEKNNNYLSFPIRGYTLSIDFKISTNLFKLLDSKQLKDSQKIKHCDIVVVNEKNLTILKKKLNAIIQTYE